MSIPDSDSATVLCVFGTRPEAIKMAPVIRALSAHAPALKPVVCVTDQHQEMLDQMLEFFGIEPDWRLGGLNRGLMPIEVAARILDRLPKVIAAARPAAVLVQGDTSTACAAALANLKIMEQDRLVANAAAMGERLVEGLRRAVGKHPIVGDVRGRGLLVCVDFVEPDGSGKPLAPVRVAELDRKAWDRGAIVYARGTVLRLAPPLCITAGEVDELVSIVADSISSLQDDLATG